MASYASFTIVATVVLWRVLVCNSQIVKAPSNQIVSPDDTAIFNCSVSCGQQLPVTWYLTLPTNSRTVAVSPFTSLSQVKNIYGIEVVRGTVNECSQGGYLVEQLFVKAKQQLKLMPVQCSSVCFGDDCLCGDNSLVHFSKLAVLSVDIGGTISPSTSPSPAPDTYVNLPSPQASPSGPTSVSCNSVRYVTTTVTSSSSGPNPGPIPTPLTSPDVMTTSL